VDFAKNEETKQLSEQFDGAGRFIITPIIKFLHGPWKTVGLFSGNQAGKTSSVAYQYFQRIFGIHPCWEKNLLAKKIRCMSSSLPESSSPEEQDNTQYLELKKLIPPQYIEKDVTSRNTTMVIRRPVGLNTTHSVIEFRSSKQELQDLGKIQLSSVWHDEETPKGHREECRMRLLAEDGDEIFSLTPTNALTYTFDEIWERAEYIERTPTIAEKFNLPIKEYPNKGTGIACMQMATDDNPTLDSEIIDRILADVTDPDIYAIRRYGVFRAVSGRVHKAYNPKVHYISMNKYFPDGIPYDWVHARGIDYHESRTPWSVGWMSASHQNEWFLWQEFHPAIDGPHAFNTFEIARAIARKSGDLSYIVNLIDPLANKKQANTLFSTTDDINRYFDDLRQNYGMGTPAYWTGWDTKGTTGRDEIGKRFKNASRCGVPFNNRIRDKGRMRHLPTIWVMDTCPNFNRSIMKWRYQEYMTSQTQAVNDPNVKPMAKMSHDNMVMECIAKDPRMLHAAHFYKNPPRQTMRKKISVAGR